MRIMWKNKLLLNILNKIEKYEILNRININKKKILIMILKSKNDRNEIEGYPIIKQYKYGLKIYNNMKINSHIGIIDKNLGKYFKKIM